MWFAALDPNPNQNPWIVALMERILRGDTRTLSLLPSLPPPFDSSPPKHIRARLYAYDFNNPKSGIDTPLNSARMPNKDTVGDHGIPGDSKWASGSWWKRKVKNSKLYFV